MGNFGALTDHFGILEIEGMSDILELVDSSKVPRAESRADAMDENNDIADSDYYGNGAGEIFEVSCTYAVKAGTLDLSDIVIGEIKAAVVASGLEVTTANSAWPQITVSGLLGTETMIAPTGFTNQFTLPAISVVGMKQAQPLGFTVSAGRLTGSSLSVSLEVAEQADGLGEPVAHGISGGTGEVSAEFVRITDAPAMALADPLTTSKWNAAIVQPPGATEPQAGHHTASASINFTVTRDASA